MSSAASRKPRLLEHPTELADLGPEDRPVLMLAVEGVVLHEHVHHAGEVDQIVEGGPVGVGGQQLPVLTRDPVPLRLDLLAARSVDSSRARAST